MIRLSVNVNKIATLRNSRGGRTPDVLHAVQTCIAAGVQGITVHPRADRRHITPDDVRGIGEALGTPPRRVELNIEGDARPDLIDLVRETRPDQCTLVPVLPGEITSQAGWRPGPLTGQLPEIIRDLKTCGIRVSVFIDADPASVSWAASVGADRVELYTEPFARAFEHGAAKARESFAHYADIATRAHASGLGVNAGHDLDLDNLTLFRNLPFLDEVSIGHALISRAVFVGLPVVLREYLDVLVGD